MAIKRQVFYSFHYQNDVFRVSQIRNIGAIEDNKPVSDNEWEKVRGKDEAIKKWIDDNMRYRSCVVVLVGSETANRKWVLYEIKKAWDDGKGVVGIYIHDIKCPNYGTCSKGVNPFTKIPLSNGKLLSDIVKCYNSKNPPNAYNDIRANLEKVIEEAISIRNKYRG